MTTLRYNKVTTQEKQFPGKCLFCYHLYFKGVLEYSISYKEKKIKKIQDVSKVSMSA